MPSGKRPAGIHRLTVREVMHAGIGDTPDGGGLYLRCTDSAASWVLRYTSPAGKRREMGLGSCTRQNAEMTGRSLTDARRMAAEARAMLAEAPARDPIEERDRAKRAEREEVARRKMAMAGTNTTLARVARTFHEKHIEPRLSVAQSARWIGSLERHVPPAIWGKPVGQITSFDLLDFLGDLQATLDDTARRVRRRLDEVLDYAIDAGFIDVNPMANLRMKLARRHKPGKDVPRPSLPYPDVPEFVRLLRLEDGIAARCLEFTILTAARTGEAIGASWAEFNEEAGVWTIPAKRMKGGETHVVYLQPRALEILAAMRELGSSWVFPSPADMRKHLSNMGMLKLLQRMGRRDITVHGFRASFSTWANEEDIARPDVIEACLAHKEADRIRASYNRATCATARRALLLAWADYVEGNTAPGGSRHAAAEGVTAPSPA